MDFQNRAVRLCFMSIALMCCLFVLPSEDGSWSTQAAVEARVFPYAVTWNNNGRLAIATLDGVRMYDDQFQLLTIFPPVNPIYPLQNAVWSPDGRRLLVGNTIIDSETLLPLVQLDIGTTEEQPFGWSPNGQWVFRMALDYRSIEHIDTQTGKVVGETTGENIRFPSVFILSRDGKRFLAREGCCAILIMDAQTGDVPNRWIFDHHISDMAWSPDSQSIAYFSLKFVSSDTPETVPVSDIPGQSILLEMHVIDSTSGSTIQSINLFPHDVNQLFWSPDGTEISTVFTEVATWDIESGLPVYTFRPNGRVQAATYSPYGGRLLLGLWPENSGQLQPIAPQSYSQTYLDGTIQIIVPAPSLEKLNRIIPQCGLSDSIEQALTSTTSDLLVFIDQLSALTDEQINSACRADLLAVAEALLP